MWTTISNELIWFLVWPIPETEMGILCIFAAWVPYHIPVTHHVMRPFPLRFSTPQKRYNSTATHGDRQKQKKTERYPGCLAHAVSGVGGFHTVRGGIDPMDHRFRARFIGLVDVSRYL